jgi:glucokinase
MYLGIDIGGTKTLLATLDEKGVIQESYRFITPDKYGDFLKDLALGVDKLSTKKFLATGVGVPGKLNRKEGIDLAFGSNRKLWNNIPIRDDIRKIVNCKVSIENDANLAGLSEALLAKQFNKVLYVTISTGIGTGFIVDRQIDADMLDTEGGHIMLEHGNKIESWETFASGKAIVKRFGKRASDITDEKTWRIIARNIALGLVNLIVIMQPDVIILGGGVGAHYEKYADFLSEYLKEYKDSLFNIPVIQKAVRPELAVIYGCYELIKQQV